MAAITRAIVLRQILEIRRQDGEGSYKTGECLRLLHRFPGGFQVHRFRISSNYATEVVA